MIVGEAHPMLSMSSLTFLGHNNLMLTELFCEGLKSWDVDAVRNTFSVEDAIRGLHTPMLDSMREDTLSCWPDARSMFTSCG